MDLILYSQLARTGDRVSLAIDAELVIDDSSRAEELLRAKIARTLGGGELTDPRIDVDHRLQQYVFSWRVSAE
jgi:hypothetical protein